MSNQYPPPSPPPSGYGNPYGSSPPNAPYGSSPPPGGDGPTGKSALGLDANVTSALGYVIGIIAIIELIIEKQNRFAKFHAIQSLIYHVAAVVIFIVIAIMVTILTVISSYLAIFWLLYLFAVLAYFAGLIFAAVKSFQGQMFKLPIIGDIAANMANK